MAHQLGLYLFALIPLKSKLTNNSTRVQVRESSPVTVVCGVETVVYRVAAGIDAEAARKEEEEMMLRDANQWLNAASYTEQPHPKTGAYALHVAAAKGYIKVIKYVCMHACTPV